MAKHVQETATAGGDLTGTYPNPTVIVSTFDSRYLRVANNLSDVTAATARTNLGLGSIATQAANNVTITGGAVTGVTDIAIADGGTGASTAAAARTNLGIGGALFDHYADAGNSGTSETDLYSDTIAAGALGANGDKIISKYAGIFVSSATATRELKVYFGGTQVFDSGALSISAGSDAWEITVTIIRESSTVVRCSAIATTAGASLNIYDNYTRVTGLTLSSTNIIKVTGQAAGVGAATNDIVAKLGNVSFSPAAT